MFSDAKINTTIIICKIFAVFFYNMAKKKSTSWKNDKRATGIFRNYYSFFTLKQIHLFYEDIIYNRFIDKENKDTYLKIENLKGIGYRLTYQE